MAQTKNCIVTWRRMDTPHGNADVFVRVYVLVCVHVCARLCVCVHVCARVCECAHVWAHVRAHVIREIKHPF